MKQNRMRLPSRVMHAAGVCALSLACLSASAGSSDAPASNEFAWRGALALPAGASLVRVDVPVQALLP